MQASDIPAPMPTPFGADANPANIRTIPLTSADPTAATLELGFPPDTFLPITAGGTPPDGRDFNGILYWLAQWAQWFSLGGANPYNPTFQTAIGGYPSGAVVESVATPGTFWRSTADNNTSDPDTGGANWVNDNALTGAAGGDLTGSYPNPTIAAGVIVAAMFANAPAGTLLSNLGGSSGTPAWNTLASLITALGWTSGGDTTITLPGPSAAAGTVGSSGWSKDPTGKITQWAFVQMCDYNADTAVSWTFPIDFTTTDIQFSDTNYAAAAGQGTEYAGRGVLSVKSWATNGASFILRNTSNTDQLAVYRIVAEGF